MSKRRIGVLALQGAFAKHIEVLKAMGVEAIEVRTPTELVKCEGLIIPGGESTTIFKHLHFIKMLDEIAKFSQEKPMFGTCAGLILMSKKILSPGVKPFGIIDVAVERNAFGRQAESFEIPLEVQLSPNNRFAFTGVFIRAPRIREWGSDVKILSEYNNEPVLVQHGFHMGATFHPELTHDYRIHEHFLSLFK